MRTVTFSCCSPFRSYHPHPMKPVPTWFHEARFGILIHWGVYSLLEQGEHVLRQQLLNPSEYRRMAARFHAEKYDPDQWAALACEAGAKYVILTAKHGDGFCLWDTATTPFNAVQTGPRRDLVADFLRACRRHGLRVGLYYDLADWTHPGFILGETHPEQLAKHVQTAWQQIEELVSRYGRIDLLWFNRFPFQAAKPWRSARLLAMIRRHQPGILINDRLPMPPATPHSEYRTCHLPIEVGNAHAWECHFLATQQYWGWHRSHRDPSMWRSQRELTTMLAYCVGWGGNLLLNVGPPASGAMPRPFIQRARRLGEWLRIHRNAVRKTEPTPFQAAHGWVMTQRGRSLFCILLHWPGPALILPGFNEKLCAVKLLGRPVRFVQESHRVLLSGLPAREPALCSVLEMTFNRAPTLHPWARHIGNHLPPSSMVRWLDR